MGYRKCWWYDDYGQPRRQANGTFGCPRQGACTYDHPGDPNWHKALPSYLPPAHLRYPEPETSGFRDHSLSIHDASSPGPSHSSDIRSKFVPIGGGRSSPPKYPSASKRMRERSPPPSQPTTKHTLDQSKAEPRNQPRRSLEITRESSGTKLARMSPSVHTMPPPPEPKKELSAEEKLATWVERIKLMSDVVTARTEHVKLDRDVQNFKRLANSSHYSDTTPEEQALLNSQLKDLEVQCDAKKKELNAMVFRIRDLDFWPPLPRPEGSLLAEEDRLTIRKQIDDLKREVQDLQEAVKTLSSTPPNPPKPPEEHSDAPPLKRRRLSTNKEPPPKWPSSSGDDVQIPYPEMEDRVVHLEGLVTELENSLFENQNTLFEEMEDRMTERLEEYRVSQGKDPTSLLPPPPPPEFTQKLERLTEIENNLNQTGVEIAFIAEEVGELIIRANAYEREVAKLRGENDELKKHIAHLGEMQRQSLEQSEKDRAEMRALNAAITAFISQPPPTPLTAQDILGDALQSLKPELLLAIQKEMVPVMEEQNETIHKIVQARSSELSSTVLSKLALTLQTVETMTGWMDKVKQAQAQAHAGGQVNGTNK